MDRATGVPHTALHDITYYMALQDAVTSQTLINGNSQSGKYECSHQDCTIGAFIAKNRAKKLIKKTKNINTVNLIGNPHIRVQCCNNRTVDIQHYTSRGTGIGMRRVGTWGGGAG